MHQVFISYNHHDDDFVSRLVSDLEKRGWDTFSDRKLKPSENYEKILSEKLENAKYILVVVSPTSLAAHGVRKEIEAGLELERKGLVKLIPLLVADTPPEEFKERFGPKMYANFTVSYRAGLEELLSVLPKEGGKRRPMSLDRKTRIILVAIPALVTLIGLYWQFVYKPGHTDNEQVLYNVRVTNIDTQQPIKGAEVTIEAKGVPPAPYTDVDGRTPFHLDKTVDNVHIIVKATNCETIDKNLPVPKNAPNVIDVRLKCTEPKSGPGPLGLTYDHNPTIDEVRVDIERVRRVTITYNSGKCKQLVGKAVVRLNGAQLNGADAKDLLENAAKPKTDVQFSVVTRQEGSSYEITCGK